MLRPLKISAEFFQQTAPLLPSPHAERVALATFPSLVPLLYFRVCLYRFAAPALAFIAARPQLSAGLPRSTRVGPPKYMLGCQQHLVFPRGHPSRY